VHNRSLFVVFALNPCKLVHKLSHKAGFKAIPGWIT